MVFGKFSCGTYVIVVFPDMRNLFLIGSAIFSMVLSSSSIFLCGVTVFHIPRAAPKAALMSDWSTRDHVTLQIQNGGNTSIDCLFQWKED